jgi:S1-C subfamily serine protease
VPGDLLDLILIVLIAAFAVAGYRQGFIIGVLSLTGFVLGVAGGALIAPAIAHALAKSLSVQAFVAIVVVFAGAVLGMLVASGIGVAVRSRLTGRPATVADSLGGAAVNVAAVLIVAWLIGSFMASAQFPAIARQISNSAVLRTMDSVMPRSVLYLPVFPQLHSLLSNGVYSQVFSAIGEEASLSVGPPNQAVLTSAPVNRDKRSIVKIMGVASACQLRIEGSGFVISPQHVLTNAHVVAGVTDGPVVDAPNGQSYNAKVVLYDPERDLAVLDVPGLPEPPLRFADSAPAGASAIVGGYPLDEPLKMVAARVGLSVLATGPNIYGTEVVNRSIYPIESPIKPGNSGGPLLATDGRVYGVVFAASTVITNRGYALTASEADSDVAAGIHRYRAVSTEGCQGG